VGEIESALQRFEAAGLVRGDVVRGLPGPA
jgi:hypothetical protein